MATKSTTLTIRISEKTKAKLEKIAKLSRRTKSWHAGEALEIYLRNEMPIVESIVKAQADIRAGKGIPHEDVVARLNARVDAMAKRRKQV